MQCSRSSGKYPSRGKQPDCDSETARYYWRAAHINLLIGSGGWALPASAQTNPTDTQSSCSTFSNFCDLIIREAGRTGLDPALIDAVMAIESNYQVNTMGAAGEIGLMQVLPSTAKLLGFRGDDAELAEPATNIRLGATYLAGAWNLSTWGPLPVIDEVSCRSWRGPDDRIIDRVLPTCTGTPCASEPSSY